MSDTETYAVVYQFGKVASTSLVATLNELPGVEAVQSHFLGPGALHKMVDVMLSRDTSDFFFEQGIRQFEHNMRVSRRMEAIMQGKRGERLVVVTLSRDPLQWFRSAVTQLIDGHLPTINATTAHFGLECEDDAARVEAGLRTILDLLARTITELGGVEPTLELMHARMLNERTRDLLPQIPGLNVLFRLCLRPFDWFGSHFEVAMETRLDQLHKADGFWHGKRRRAEMVVFRYEDLDRVLQPAMRHVGLALDTALKRENLSRSKPFDKAVRAAFRSSAVQPLAAQFDASRYSRFFGYAAPAEAQAADRQAPVS